jgi:putative pyoverdin transport system ATP-binding/permease protein
MKPEPLTLTRLILQSSPKLLWSSLVLSLVAGVCYSLLIPFLMLGIGPVPAQGWMAENFGLLFFALCLVTFGAKAASLILVTYLVKDLAADMRIRLCRKINRAGVQDIDTFGMARLTNILVEDIGRVSFAAVCLPMVAVQVTTVVGMLVYLAFLDWRVFLCAVAVIVGGLFLNRIPLRISLGYMEQSRRIRDQVQDGVKGIVFGAYELKLARAKSEQFLEEEIIQPELKAARIDKIADTYLHVAGSFVELISFFVIGLVAFVLPRYFSFQLTDIYAIVMALLYVMLPIMMAYMLLPNIQRGSVALAQIEELEALTEEPVAGEPIGAWSTFEVRNLQYRYHNAAEPGAGFRLQPITLRFRKGEVVFVVGGNGSGKSTLSKLISLHYAPESGEIRFDDTRVGVGNLGAAREQIAVIYSNYYLFERVYGPVDSAREASMQRYLRLFGLQDKVRFEGGRFSTTKLSDGQRRRLALVVALLDDRQIYLLDEWAADQDPEFREIFYTQLLQQMRADGKLVIVITHDDRYFHHADRVVVMEFGGVRQDTMRQHTLRQHGSVALQS